jgi:hypothetical protein
MTTREEAAREAIRDAFLDRSYDCWPDMENEAKAALRSADAVMLSDATVERGAWALYRADFPDHAATDFSQVGGPIGYEYKCRARAVLKAALEG